MKPSRVHRSVHHLKPPADDHDAILFTAPAASGGTLDFTLSVHRWQILRNGALLESGGSSSMDFEAGLMRFHELSASSSGGTKRGWNGRRRWHGWTEKHK